MIDIVVSIMIATCGLGDSPKQWRCYDYINNCLIGYGGKVLLDKKEICTTKAEELLNE